MKTFLNVIYGVLVGVANVIPGVSGGTMAVSLGIYDRLIGSISGIVKEWKKSLAFLIPLLLGAAIGIVGFSRIMETLLEEYPLQTSGAFIGLIFGGIPVLLLALRRGQKEQGSTKLTVWNVIAFVLFLAIAVILPLLQGGGSESAVIAVSVPNALILFVLGIVASATMVIPGVSGSMVLMILGYYYGVLNLVNSFIDALVAVDIGTILKLCLLLIPFGLGVLAGIGGIAKLIEYLLKKHCVTTYFAIFGLVASSPFGILYKSGAFAKTPSVVAVVVAFMLCIACAVAILWFTKWSESKMKGTEQK